MHNVARALSVAPPPLTARVHADATPLVQVFGNLLHNAAEYTPDGGTRAIAAHDSGAHIAITVTDSGAGISGPMLDAIFDLFTQLPHSLARFDGGPGIGLTLARRIVQIHGGSIKRPVMGWTWARSLSCAWRSRLRPGWRDLASPAWARLRSMRRVRLLRILQVDDNVVARTYDLITSILFRCIDNDASMQLGHCRRTALQ